LCFDAFQVVNFILNQITESGFFFLKISKDRLCMNDLLEHSFCTSKAIYQNCLLPEQNQYIFLAGFLLAVKASSTTCFPFEE